MGRVKGKGRVIRPSKFEETPTSNEETHRGGMGGGLLAGSFCVSIGLRRWKSGVVGFFIFFYLVLFLLLWFRSHPSPGLFAT